MRTLVVSDLHLDPSEPSRYHAAAHAVSTVQCDQLILAGDVFEAWIGADGATSADLEFLEHMSELAKDCLLIPGNRDFLLSPDWLFGFGIRWQAHVITQGALIIHGDELCTDDHEYQAFRAEVRSPDWQAAFLAKSLSERQSIAESLRNTSRETQANRQESIGDAVEQTVNTVMQEHAVDLLLHGHTHRPAVHSVQQGLRAVTSDWTDSGIGLVLEQTETERRVDSLFLGSTVELLQSWSQVTGTPEWKRNV
jgi:UDP-2,3-diacylglucosamine hydrolase